MCGMLLLCVGCNSYVWDATLMCGILLLLKNINHNRSSPHSVRGDKNQQHQWVGLIIHMGMDMDTHVGTLMGTTTTVLDIISPQISALQ